MPDPTQGGSASHNGRVLERSIVPALTSKGITELKYSKWIRKPQNYGTELLLSYVPYTNIYGQMGHTEFLLKSARLPEDVRIECKWQQVGGSVDEKYPCLFLNCVQRMPEHTIFIVVGGSGARRGSLEWLRHECTHVTTKAIRVLTLDEFIQWVNRTLG
jgi:hypothetical protein